MKQVIIKGYEIKKYLMLRKQGFKTLWTGNNLICLYKKG